MSGILLLMLKSKNLRSSRTLHVIGWWFVSENTNVPFLG